jgi:hypothetical protein
MGQDWIHLVLRPLFGLLYQPQIIDDDDDDCGAIGGMRISSWHRSTRRKPASVPLCPLQIPHVLTRARTRTAAVGSRRVPAWAMALTWSIMEFAYLYYRKYTVNYFLSKFCPTFVWINWTLKIMVKIKFSLCSSITATKTYGIVKVNLHAFSILAADGGKCPASHFDRSTL